MSLWYARSQGRLGRLWSVAVHPGSYRGRLAALSSLKVCFTLHQTKTLPFRINQLRNANSVSPLFLHSYRMPGVWGATSSFVAQRFDGVELGGLHGGEPAADHANDDQDGRRKHHGNERKLEMDVDFAGIILVGRAEKRQSADG